MKSIIYKNRVISAILLYLLTLLLTIYLYTYNATYFILIIIPLIAFINRKILGNGTDLSNKQKILITVSLVVMGSVFLFYIYNMTINKIIK